MNQDKVLPKLLPIWVMKTLRHSAGLSDGTSGYPRRFGVPADTNRLAGCLICQGKELLLG